MFKIDKKKTKSGGSIVEYLEKSEFKGTGYDYYQEFGTWEGLGAERLGLAGLPILKGEMEKLANCIHPKTGEKIGKKSKNGLDDAYLKTSLSAPKDFSLVYFLDESLGQKALEEDYRYAVKETLNFMEQFCLTKVNSNNEMKQAGLIIANISHETARPTKEKEKVSILRPDPQKHEHSLISRLVVDEDGKVSALHNRLYFHNQVMIGAFFRKELGNRLAKRGYQLTRRTEYVDRDTKGSYSKNQQKVKINTWAIDGITDEHRKYFSKRNNEIEALAQKFGAETAIAKDLIANDYKQAKFNYERGELIKEWKNDAQKIGLTNEYLQSIKNKNPMEGFLKNYRTDDELLASVVNNGDVYHKNIMARLYEDEAWTHRNAEERFKGMVESGKLKPNGKNKFTCTVDLSLIKKQSKKLNMKMATDRTRTYKILSSGKISDDDFLNNRLTHAAIDSLVNGIDILKDVALIMMLSKNSKNKDKEFQDGLKASAKSTNKKEVKNDDASVDLGGGISLSSLEDIRGQISYLNSKLTLAHLSEQKKIEIRLKMEQLAKKLAQMKIDMLNQKPKLK